MNLEKSKRFLAILAVCYWLMMITIGLVAGDQFRSTAVTGDAMSPALTVGEIVDGITVTQQVQSPAEKIVAVDLLVDTYGRTNTGTLQLQVHDLQGNLLGEASGDVSGFANAQYVRLAMDTPVQTREGESLVLTLEAPGAEAGNAVSVYYGTSIAAGRVNVPQQLEENERFALSGEIGAGKLCVKLNGINEHIAVLYCFWAITITIFVIFCFLCVKWWREAKQGRGNPLVSVCTLYFRYSFLLKQLVSRDFKNKYKRSVLGMLWSVLNPLLTMSVQYVVFSTLFKSDTENYPVYLLTGIVFFNYFSEAISQGMMSIMGNASLIKKVYVPKYIYPISKVMSSLVNFGLAFLPLFVVMIVTGIRFRPALLLLVFDILCLLCFVTGMVLILTVAMTFFQDTQFLWNVVSMIWMYLTPIFYTESIIPQNMLTVYRMNPMYQYIMFARTCIIDGVSPAPANYLWCILSAAVVLLLGIAAFRKNQDKFVLCL